MKVICVTTEYSGMLTIGKWYDVVDGGDDFYTIIWNNGYQANLSKSYFKTIEEIRQDKLNELGV